MSPEFEIRAGGTTTCRDSLDSQIYDRVSSLKDTKIIKISLEQTASSRSEQACVELSPSGTGQAIRNGPGDSPNLLSDMHNAHKQMITLLCLSLPNLQNVDNDRG